MKILLAVSGGIDSMYMAYRAPELFPGASFAVAHCNFHLRAGESDGDEAFVTEWCRSKGIKCFVKGFDTASYAAERGISIEMAARDIRYGWFAELCEAEGFDAVAVAHNANDNAETLILNLLRGTGSRGLRGMSSDKILRPMLGITREEIRKWMTSHEYSWREDRTNSDSTFKRNRIRNEVFPLFEQINPSFLRTLQRDMKHFSQVDDIAEDYFLQAKEAIMSDGAISVTELRKFKHWEYLLWRLLEEAGLSEETFGKLVELLKSGRTISGKEFESPTHIVSIKLKSILIRKR